MRFDTDSLQKYVWLLKFIEGQANEYTSNHGFKTPKSCVDFGTSEYIPGEVGLDPANHPKGRVHSSQDEGQHECQHKQPAHGGCRVHTILHLVLFNTHQTKAHIRITAFKFPYQWIYMVIGVGMGEIVNLGF